MNEEVKINKQQKKPLQEDDSVQTLIVHHFYHAMVAIRKTCGAGGLNRTQLQPTNRHTSWSGESSTPGFGETLSELSGVDVNDGFWANGVCIDYRLCLMGHNSLQGCLGSAMPLNCELCNPHKSTHGI